MQVSLACGCEPLGAYRCPEALALWDVFQVLSRESAAAHVRFGRELTPANQAASGEASRRKWDAWDDYANHFGDPWKERLFTDGFMSVTREETRQKQTIADWRAEEKRRSRNLEPAGGGWD